jgi:hypothetical protein
MVGTPFYRNFILLRINSIIYALELMLYDPNSEEEITPLKLFEVHFVNLDGK